ncbi:MFS transporter [Pseudarthrobacter sulfonivorans]
MLGTMIDASDLVMYAYLTVYTAPLFFPNQNPLVSVLATLGVYAVGFLARPIGGILFGRMGDRRGRRATLVATLLLMGGSTLLVGLIPSYAAIGIFAPILVLLARIAQGIAAGGEVMGAATYALESSTPGRRGFYSSMTPLGSILGLAVAPTVIGLTTLAVGPEAMAAWGWRIPFVVAAIITLGVLTLRLKVEDSAEFVALEKTGGLSQTPLRETWRSHKATIGWTIVMGAGALYIVYAIPVYLPIYFTTSTELSPATVPWITAGVMLLTAPMVVVGGLCADRFGRVRFLVTMLVILGIVGYPLFLVLSSHGAGTMTITLTYFGAMVLSNLALAALYQAFADVFPARIRYTAAAIGYNIGNMIGAGFGPLASTALIQSTGNSSAPGFLFIGGAILGIVGLVAVTRLHRAQPQTEPVGELNGAR